jgi:phytoene synthase
MKAWQKAFEQGMHESGQENSYLHAVLHTTKIFTIEPKLFSKLAKSRIDFYKKNEFQTYSQLEKSLNATSERVADILCEILKISHPKAKKQVARLAKAGELIELLSDFSKALERGKMYFPVKDLKKFGYTKQSLERKKVTKSWEKLIESYLQKAEADISAGLKNVSHFPEHSQLAFITIAQTYQHLLQNIREKEYDLFTYQPKLHWKLKLKQSLPLLATLVR